MKIKRDVRSCFAICIVTLLLLCVSFTSCSDGTGGSGRSVRPRTLRDVPANKLAFRFEPDVKESDLPPAITRAAADEEKHERVRFDFETRRTADALFRTITSPDGARVLAVYATAATDDNEYKIDVYATDGTLVRAALPANLSAAFASIIAWSPDGNYFAFAGFKSTAPVAEQSSSSTVATPSTDAPTADNANDANSIAAPIAGVSPAVITPEVPAFSTEQLYVCNRDGYDLRPLTKLEGLIYFQFAWSPDSRSVAALACREDEWEARIKENLAPAGRPRLLSLDGSGAERLLDDRLTQVAPVWSPDGSKVATAFETDVFIYDAAGGRPTVANLELRDTLFNASVQYEKTHAKPVNTNQNQNGKDGKASANRQAVANDATSSPDLSSTANVLSFNPIIELQWSQPDVLFAQSGFVRVINRTPTRNYLRWHVLRLSAQATLLSRVNFTSRRVTLN